MYGRSLGLLAATAVAANAILLPPEISSASSNYDDPVLALLGLDIPKYTTIEIFSGQCVGREGECQLAFNASTAENSKTLLINGVPFYTSDPTVTSNPMNTPVTITQLDSTDNALDYRANPGLFASKELRLTGSSFETGPPEYQSESGEQIIPMKFQIYSLDGQAVNVPRVTLKVYKLPDGYLRVLYVTVSQVDPNVKPEDKLCKDWPMVCQWRDFLMSKAGAAKEGIKKLCGGKMKGMPPPPPPPPHRGGPPVRLHHPHHFEEGDMPPPPHGGHRRPFGGHHGHRHHKHHGDLSVANILMMIVGALMMLMVTWILGYVVGTVVGYCIVGLWLLYRRMRGTPKYQRVAAEEEGAYAEDEKIVVEEEEEEQAEIPKEDPPAYEEKEVVV